MDTLLEKYLKLADEAGVINGTTLKSQEWYRKFVRMEPHINNLDRLTRSLERTTRLKPGQLVVFQYSAKYAATLPYWDRHPLVLIDEITPNGWSGTNFHYIHPRIRARILYERSKGNFGQKFGVQHDAMKNSHKKYLASHVTKSPREVPMDLWNIVIQMPFEAFEKASKESVWNKTSRKAKKT